MCNMTVTSAREDVVGDVPAVGHVRVGVYRFHLSRLYPCVCVTRRLRRLYFNVRRQLLSALRLVPALPARLTNRPLPAPLLGHFTYSTLTGIGYSVAYVEFHYEVVWAQTSISLSGHQTHCGILVHFWVKQDERYYGPGRHPLAYLLYYMPTVSPACA